MERLLPRHRQGMLGKLCGLRLDAGIGHLEAGEEPFRRGVHEHDRRLAPEAQFIAAQEPAIAAIEPQPQRGFRFYPTAVIAKEEQLAILEDQGMNDTDHGRATHDDLCPRCLVWQTRDADGFASRRAQPVAERRRTLRYPAKRAMGASRNPAARRELAADARSLL